MKRIKMLLAFFWIAAVMVWAVMTSAKIAKTPGFKLDSKAGVQAWVRKALLDNCWGRELMVNLYGGWTRLSGATRCNGVTRTFNGQLTSGPGSVNCSGRDRRLRKLRDCALGAKAEFLYVQMPSKVDRGGRLVPRGLGECRLHSDIDKFLSGLAALKVPYLDVRGCLDGTPEDVDRYFFKTDHHWNFDGAFKVFPIVARALASRLHVDEAVIADQVAESSWERRRLPRPFLGTVGRRVGTLFADMDEIHYYVPQFSTSISKTVESRDIHVVGPFEDSVMSKEYFEVPSSPFVDCGYSIYGSDYDHVRYMNAGAPVKKNLLVVKDSFALPVIAWLSTVFRRIDVIDLRHYKRYSLADAVNIFSADAVVVMYNPGGVGTGRMWEFGDCSKKAGTGEAKAFGDVMVRPRKHNYNHEPLGENLAPGALYRVYASSVEITAGKSAAATIGLYDRKRKRSVASHRVTMEAPECLFEVPVEANGYDVLLYAGEMGHAMGVGARWHDVKLRRIR